MAAHALDLVGDRWALLIVRELLLGPKRFGAVKAGLPGIATNVLTDRLVGLEAARIVTRATLPSPASAPVYALTPAGAALRPVIEALGRWGAMQPGHDPRLWISPTALMLSMRCFYDPARGTAAIMGFDMGSEAFVMQTGATCTVTRDDPAHAPMRLTGTANALAAIVYGTLPLTEATAAGLVGFAGDAPAGQAFLNGFALPI